MQHIITKNTLFKVYLEDGTEDVISANELLNILANTLDNSRYKEYDDKLSDLQSDITNLQLHLETLEATLCKVKSTAQVALSQSLK